MCPSRFAADASSVFRCLLPACSAVCCPTCIGRRDEACLPHIALSSPFDFCSRDSAGGSPFLLSVFHPSRFHFLLRQNNQSRHARGKISLSRVFVWTSLVNSGKSEAVKQFEPKLPLSSEQSIHCPLRFPKQRLRSDRDKIKSSLHEFELLCIRRRKSFDE